jgi:hypothetical protein
LIHLSNGTHDLKGSFNPTGLVRFGSGTMTFDNAFTPAGIVTNTSASLTFNVAQSFQDVEFLGGSVRGPAEVSFNGNVNLRSVNFDGTGRTIFGTNATVRMPTTGGISIARPLENHGTVIIPQKRSITLTRELRNQPSGTITVEDGLDVNWNGGTPSLSNAGTINKNGTNGLNIFSIPINNSGVLNLNRGLTEFRGNSTNVGMISIVDTNATLLIGSGNFVISTNNQFAGSGYLRSGGSTTVRLEADVDFGSLQVFFGGGSTIPGNFLMANSPGGSITFEKTVTVSGTLLIGGHLATTATNVTVTINGDLLLSSGSTVTNPGVINVKGDYENNGADIDGNEPIDLAGFAPFALTLEKVAPVSSEARALAAGAAEVEVTVAWNAAPGLRLQVQTSADLDTWTTQTAAVQEVSPGFYRATVRSPAKHVFIRTVHLAP